MGGKVDRLVCHDGIADRTASIWAWVDDDNCRSRGGDVGTGLDLGDEVSLASGGQRGRAN